MEHNHEGLEDDFPLQTDNFQFPMIFQGEIWIKKKGGTICIQKKGSHGCLCVLWFFVLDRFFGKMIFTLRILDPPMEGFEPV